MASYSTITAAIALGVERKRLENLLLRCRIPGTSRGRQGRARRLSTGSLLAIAMIVRLQDELGIQAPKAAQLLADGLLLAAAGSRNPHRHRVDSPVQPGDSPAGATSTVRRGPFSLTVDVAQLERELAAALGEAMEVSPRPRRGRPAGTRRGSDGPEKRGTIAVPLRPSVRR